MMPLYFVAASLSWFINQAVFFLKVYNKKGLENSGKVVMVSNHVSFWDPVLLGGAFKKQIYYLSKAELFKNKIIGGLLRNVGAFPVLRGQADFAALKKSFEVLQSGKCLGIFPEGTRVKGEVGEFQKGAAAIAIKMDAPVLPVYIDGEYKLFKQMRVVVGSPINLKDIVDIKEKDANIKGTEVIRQEIIKLKETLNK